MAGMALTIDCIVPLNYINILNCLPTNFTMVDIKVLLYNFFDWGLKGRLNAERFFGRERGTKGEGKGGKKGKGTMRRSPRLGSCLWKEKVQGSTFF